MIRFNFFNHNGSPEGDKPNRGVHLKIGRLHVYAYRNWEFGYHSDRWYKHLSLGFVSFCISPS